MSGLIHIYTGDGKGKSTAAAGLALRCAGRGGRVLYAQFLKDGASGELRELNKIENIDLFLCDRSFGFTFLMDERTKKEAASCYEKYFARVVKKAVAPYALLILDEVVGAVNSGMLRGESLTDFLKNKPEGLEVALTGRDPSWRLTDLADYVSEIKKIKHPYDRGIDARPGIEF